MSDSKPRATISLPSDFFFGELRPDYTKPAPPPVPPPLGPLSAFAGSALPPSQSHHPTISSSPASM
jgi:hypothetical protein